MDLNVTSYAEHIWLGKMVQFKEEIGGWTPEYSRPVLGETFWVMVIHDAWSVTLCQSTPDGKLSEPFKFSVGPADGWALYVRVVG
jgi:hypothetical protein